MAHASGNAEDRKLWPLPIAKHFIDVLVEELKGNMPQGMFKKGLWGFIQKEFNRHASKNYHKDQVR